MVNIMKISKDLIFVDNPRGYYYKGKKMQGITRLIGKRLNKNFPTGGKIPQHVTDAAEFGSLVHEDVEEYIKSGKSGAHPASKFVIKQLERNYPKKDYDIYGELLVTDKRNYATAIDIVAVNKKTGKAVTFDIKTGIFDREYCSFQLGIGNYLLNLTYGLDVEESYVLATKTKHCFRIIPKKLERVKSLLGHN